MTQNCKPSNDGTLSESAELAAFIHCLILHEHDSAVVTLSIYTAQFPKCSDHFTSGLCCYLHILQLWQRVTEGQWLV